MASYVVGDIQGCYDPLVRLLDHIKFRPSRDVLWSVGDMVNRGPNNTKVLRLLRDLDDAFIGVLGNHDLHLLAVAAGHREPKRSDTICDVLRAKDSNELIDWLNDRPLFYFDQATNTAMSHAGIPPMWSIKKAGKLAREVEAVLRSKDRNQYFKTMYGNTPEVWDDNLKGTDRWRVITNYLTRMRFCKANGELDLIAKGSATTAPSGFAPWFTHRKRKAADTRIVFGHWATLLGHVRTKNVEALDTGCVWGNTLTCMELESGARYSVPATPY